MTKQGLRTAFRYFNRFMVLLWRLDLGRWVNCWPSVLGRVMVLINVGRRTGLERRTPLNYAMVSGDIHCIAAFGADSDWHRNIVEHPEVEVWLPDGWWAGIATDVSRGETRLALLREVLVASGFAAYCAGIRPKTISDDELARVTEDYRVLRIERTRELSSRGGPGDLSWVWPIVSLLLLIALLLG